jgi:hypothetical protein
MFATSRPRTTAAQGVGVASAGVLPRRDKGQVCGEIRNPRCDGGFFNSNQNTVAAEKAMAVEWVQALAVPAGEEEPLGGEHGEEAGDPFHPTWVQWAKA